MLSDAEVFDKQVGQSVLAMVTSARNSDSQLYVIIGDLDSAGPPSAYVVRMKLFALDNQMVIRKAGALAANDRKAVVATLRRLLRLKG